MRCCLCGAVSRQPRFRLPRPGGRRTDPLEAGQVRAWTQRPVAFPRPCVLLGRLVRCALHHLGRGRHAKGLRRRADRCRISQSAVRSPALVPLVSVRPAPRLVRVFCGKSKSVVSNADFEKCARKSVLSCSRDLKALSQSFTFCLFCAAFGCL